MKTIRLEDDDFVFQNADEKDRYIEECQFFDFIKTQKRSLIQYGKHPIYFLYKKIKESWKSGCVFIDNNKVYGFFASISGSSITQDVVDSRNYPPSAVILPDGGLILNADLEDSDYGPYMSLVGIEGFENYPTLSFQCLANFESKNPSNHTINKICKKLKGVLKVVDFQPDHSIPLTKREINTYKRWDESFHNGPCPVPPPDKSYTIVDNVDTVIWHKPASVVVTDTDTKQCYLFGQDEGQYFGVELPVSVSSVKEAFEVLVPKEAKGTDYHRQGEWFLVPVSAKDVPDEKDCIITIEEYFNLPRENPDSLFHVVTSHETRILDQIYSRNPNVTHDEHHDLCLKGWYTFHRNTAIRSVSVDGVD